MNEDQSADAHHQMRMADEEQTLFVSGNSAHQGVRYSLKSQGSDVK